MLLVTFMALLIFTVYDESYMPCRMLTRSFMAPLFALHLNNAGNIFMFHVDHYFVDHENSNDKRNRIVFIWYNLLRRTLPVL